MLLHVNLGHCRMQRWRSAGTEAPPPFPPSKASDAIRKKSTLDTCDLTGNSLQRVQTEGGLKIYVAFKDSAGVPHGKPCSQDKTYLG